MCILELKMFIFFSHYNDNIVSVYKNFKYFDANITIFRFKIELIHIHIFDKPYHVFNTNFQGQSFLLSDENSIDIWKIISPYKMIFKSTLPLYNYKSSVKFWFNKNNEIAYVSRDSYLYIVMIDQTNPKNRLLFVYIMTEINHNSLKAVIRLSQNYYRSDIALKIDDVNYSSLIYIFCLYTDEKNKFQFIKFEKDIYMRK